MKRFFYVLLFVLALAPFQGCDLFNFNPLVGQWSNSSNTIVLQFKKDKSITAKSSDTTYQGTYSVKEQWSQIRWTSPSVAIWNSQYNIQFGDILYYEWPEEKDENGNVKLVKFFKIN